MNFEIKVSNFSLAQTLFSGQCFRFEQLNLNKFKLYAKNNYVEVEQNKNVLIFKNSSCSENFWLNFFDLNRNYSKFLSKFVGDGTLEKAMKFCGGIHILKQDPFEVLITFLMSSNNNITRIKKIIEKMCCLFGEKKLWGYAFPTLNQLLNVDFVALQSLKLGYRLTYLIDAVKKLSLNEVNLLQIKNSNLEKARKQLQQIKGIGPKIADCVLLFGFNEFKAFPCDVWMLKVLRTYYFNGLSKQILSCPGLAQQLLYHSKRCGVI